MNEVLYTLSDAEKLIDYRRELLYKRKKSMRNYFIKQKLLGLLLLLIGFAIPYVLQDITASIVLIPLGLCLIFTKDKVLSINNN